MTLLRALFMVWFIASAPLTAAAGNPCAHHDAAPQTAGHHLHEDAAVGQPANGTNSATGHAHHAMPGSGGQLAHQDQSQHATTATGVTADCCEADCCEPGGTCSGARCATAPGVLMPAATPHSLPNRSGRAPFVVSNTPDPTPGHPRTLLRPPA